MKYLIISPRTMHKNLLAFYRQKDPFSDVKIMSKESLIGDYKGRVKPEALKYLIKKYGYSYDNGKALIPFLPYIDSSFKELNDIKEDLIKEGLFIKNKFIKTFLEGKEALIYGYSENDKELMSLLYSFNVPHQFIKNNHIKENLVLKKYESAVDEVFYTLNEIASLVEKGVDINNIYIFNKHADYEYYLEEFSSDFGFVVEQDNSHSLFETSLASTFLNKFRETRNVDEALESINDCEDVNLLDTLKEVINSSIDEELSFELQLDYLIGELKSTKYDRKTLQNVVRVIKQPIYVENAEIFVLGLAQGIYPTSNKDDRLLSDKTRKMLEMNTSIDEALIGTETLRDFFLSNNSFHFSFSSHSLSQKYFVSPFVSEFKMKEEKAIFPKVIYSRNMLDFYYAKALDLKKYYSDTTPEYYGMSKISDIPYDSFDNSFTGVSVFNSGEDITYSYSRINTFYKCPFQYYVSNVLNVDPFEGNFFTKFGNVAHAVFEHQNELGFDFDSFFDEQVEEQGFNDEELPLINNLKFQIGEASKACIVHEQYMTNPKYLLEKGAKVQIGPHSYIFGKIDKAIVLDNKYLVIVDYKTGNDSFSSKNIEDGVSLQLPTYYLLANKGKELPNYPIVGLFINNVVDTSLSHSVDKDNIINPYYRLNGKVIDNLQIIKLLDSSVTTGKSNFIKGVGINKDGSLKSAGSSIASFEEMNYYGEVALRKFKEADSRIRNNDFSINPLYISESNNACVNCEYRDICFVKPNQRRYLSNEEKEESEEEDDE